MQRICCLFIVLFLMVASGLALAATPATPPTLNSGEVTGAVLGAEKPDDVSIWNKYLPSTNSASPKNTVPQATPSSESPKAVTKAPASSPPSDTSKPVAQPKTQASPSASKPTPPVASAQREAKTTVSDIALEDLLLYVRDTKPTFADLLPAAVKYLGDDTELLILQLMMSVEAKDFRLSFQNNQESVIMECIPRKTENLSKLEKEGLTLHELAAMLGPEALSVAAKLDSRLGAERAIGTESPGIFRLHNLFMATADGYLLVSDNMATLVEVKARRTQKESMFVVPEGYDVWSRWALRGQYQDVKQQVQTIGMDNWIGMNSMPHGWKFSYGSGSDSSDLSKILKHIPPLPLAALETYGTDAPYFLAGMNANFLAVIAALDKPNDDKETLEFLDFCGKASIDLGSATLSIGGTHGNVMGFSIPGITLTFTGKDEFLDHISARFVTESKGQWISTNFPGWQSASITQGSVFDSPVPIPLLMARNNNTLVLGLMSASSFTRARPFSKGVSGVAAGKNFEMPPNVSAVSVTDVAQIWQGGAAMLAPGTPLRLLVAAQWQLSPSALILLDQLRVLSPPLQSIISWSNSPNALEGGGYIFLRRDGSSEFSKKFAELLLEVMR